MLCDRCQQNFKWLGNAMLLSGARSSCCSVAGAPLSYLQVHRGFLGVLVLNNECSLLAVKVSCWVPQNRALAGPRSWVRSTEPRTQKLCQIFVGISVESDLSSSDRCFWRKCGNLAGERFHLPLMLLTFSRSSSP